MKAHRICLPFLALAWCELQVTALSAQERAGGFAWEYRVLGKEKVLELGNKDLAAGLNKLGDEGWELAAVDSAYIFKRPRDIPGVQLAELAIRLESAKTDVDEWQERSAWSTRMAKKGLLAQARADADKARLKNAELAVDLIQKQIDAVSGSPKKQLEKLPLPKEKQKN